jgi:hypothetical protein
MFPKIQGTLFPVGLQSPDHAPLLQSDLRFAEIEFRPLAILVAEYSLPKTETAARSAGVEVTNRPLSKPKHRARDRHQCSLVAN